MKKKKPQKQDFDIGDVVMILIPEPNVTNYGYYEYNYQLGIITGNVRLHHTPKISACDVMLDFQKGLFEEFQLIRGMYADHLILIEKDVFEKFKFS